MSQPPIGAWWPAVPFSTPVPTEVEFSFAAAAADPGRPPA
jgi:hypothetical protein